jgi:hypothetical protein
VAWRGSARVAATTPSTGKMTTSHVGRHAHHLEHECIAGEAGGVSSGSSWSPMVKPSFGRRRIQAHKEAIDKISWMAECAITRSTRSTPSRWPTPVRSAGIEGGTAEAIFDRRSSGQERNERGCDTVHLAGSSPTKPGWSGPTR